MLQYPCWRFCARFARFVPTVPARHKRHKRELLAKFGDYWLSRATVYPIGLPS